MSQQVRWLRLSIAAAVLSCAFAVPCAAQESILVASPRAQAAEKRIREALRQPVTWNLRERPLAQVFAELGRTMSVSVVIDLGSFSNGGFDLDRPVTTRLHDVSAEAALSAVLSPLDLDWIIEDEMLVITPRQTADSTITTRVYAVRDLVLRDGRRDLAADADSLIDLVISTIRAETWSDVGGPGTAEYFDNAGTLVVSQTREVHDKIERLLATLRQVRAKQGIGPIATMSLSSLAPNASLVSPPVARRYAAPRAWNQPQVHR